MSEAAATSALPNKKTNADIRQICIDEIWPTQSEYFQIDDVDKLKGIFLNNRVDIGKEKRNETWACVLYLLGTSGEEEEEWDEDMEKKLKEEMQEEEKLKEWKETMEKKLFKDGETPKPFKISRAKLSDASKKLRVECDWPKRLKRNNMDTVAKSHLESCYHGRLLRKSLARKMLAMALYDHIHPETPFEWKSEKKFTGVHPETKKKQYKMSYKKATAMMKQVFSKLHPRYALPSSKCTPACRRMQEKLHTKMYKTRPCQEEFSLIWPENEGMEEDDDDDDDGISGTSSGTAAAPAAAPAAKMRLEATVMTMRRQYPFQM